MAEMERHYPFFSYIYREDVDLASGARRPHSRSELIELSKGARELDWTELVAILDVPE